MFDFKKDVLARSYDIPVIVEFSSPGCGPCFWIEKTLSEITREMTDKMEFVSLAIQSDNDFIDQYHIKSNPTTILFIKGQDIVRLKGAFPKIVVEQWINDHI